MERITSEVMCAAMDAAKEALPTGWSVTLLVNPFNGNSQVGSYISDARREDMILLLREMADALENNMDFPTQSLN